MSDKRKFINGLLTGLFLAVIIAGATYGGRKAVTVWKQYHSQEESGAGAEVVSARTMQKLQLIEDIIEENYALDMVDSKAMENGIYQGLVDSLQDPYSAYYSAEEMQEQQEKMEPEYKKWDNHDVKGVYIEVEDEDDADIEENGRYFQKYRRLSSDIYEVEVSEKVSSKLWKIKGTKFFMFFRYNPYLYKYDEGILDWGGYDGHAPHQQAGGQVQHGGGGGDGQGLAGDQGADGQYQRKVDDVRPQDIAHGEGGLLLHDGGDGGDELGQGGTHGYHRNADYPL